MPKKAAAGMKAQVAEEEEEEEEARGCVGSGSHVNRPRQLVIAQDAAYLRPCKRRLRAGRAPQYPAKHPAKRLV